MPTFLFMICCIGLGVPIAATTGYVWWCGMIWGFIAFLVLRYGIRFLGDIVEAIGDAT